MALVDRGDGREPRLRWVGPCQARSPVAPPPFWPGNGDRDPAAGRRGPRGRCGSVNGIRTYAALLVQGDEIPIGRFKFVFLSMRPRGPDNRTCSPGDA